MKAFTKRQLGALPTTPRQFIAEFLLGIFIMTTVFLLWDSGVEALIDAYKLPIGFAIGSYLTLAFVSKK